MRHTMPHLSLLLAALIAPAIASAANNANRDHYKWHDAQGNLHYADTLPPEAVMLGYDVVSPNGLIIKHVERAKTSEEIAADKREQDAKEEADARERADRQLLAAYPTEDDLKRNQRDKLRLLEQQITAAQTSLQGQEQALASLLHLTADAENNHEQLPEAQAKQLAAQRKQVDDQRLIVQIRERKRDDAIARFALETERYRELKTRLAEQK
ncbi:MAG: DUF4124 domain-containing protein [Rhodanobacter sp.]|jgi:hypothetical protein|nr:DUF4124 domain-containing protein [Rhodanobacter sp.]